MYVHITHKCFYKKYSPLLGLFLRLIFTTVLINGAAGPADPLVANNLLFNSLLTQEYEMFFQLIQRCWDVIFIHTQ